MAAPVFIRGESATTRPVVTGCWEVSGSYVIIEHIEFSSCGSLVLLAPVDHAVLRHSEVHGTLRGGGVGVQSWNGGSASEVVLWDNAIHDNGDVRAAFDQDVHGIAVGPRVHALWVVDNELARNSGDGIQINAGSAALQSTTHHIYVGRNVAYANKQSGLWTKQAEDVIFSENVSYGHRPGNSSSGVCMGGQYAPERVWFLNNVMWDCDYGIQLASDSGLGTGQTVYIIGNIMRAIHDSTGQFNPQTAWQPCGISLPGGTTRYVVQNSLYDVDSGVCVPYDTGRLVLYDNLIEGIRADGFHLRFDSPALAGRTQARGNVFAPFYRMGAGLDVTTVGPQAVGPRGSNQVVGEVGWVAAAAGNFRLRRESAAVGNGMADGLELWTQFLKRYGLFTGRDLYGTMRVLRIPDSGAVEYEGRR